MGSLSHDSIYVHFNELSRELMVPEKRVPTFADLEAIAQLIKSPEAADYFVAAYDKMIRDTKIEDVLRKFVFEFRDNIYIMYDQAGSWDGIKGANSPIEQFNQSVASRVPETPESKGESKEPVLEKPNAGSGVEVAQQDTQTGPTASG